MNPKTSSKPKRQWSLAPKNSITTAASRLTVFLVLVVCSHQAAKAQGPTITGLLVNGVASSAAPVGATLTIQGTGFGATMGFSTAALNGSPLAGAGVTPISWSDTSIVCTIPEQASSGPVVVVVNRISSNSENLAILPVITNVTPNFGLPGTAVTLFGEGFGTLGGTVTFNGVPATVGAWTNSSVVATVPTDATAGPIVATAQGQTSNGMPFTPIVLTQRFEGYQSTQSSVVSGLIPSQIAVDTNGNVYIADAWNNRVVKETPSSNGYLESTVASTGLNEPQGVAVDAHGNVYIADTGNGRVLKETLSAGTYSQSVVSRPGQQRRFPVYLAVDKNQVVYVADAVYGSVWIETPKSGGGYTETSISWTAYGMGTPEAVAVDNQGDVFIASTSSQILKGTPSGSSYIISAIPVYVRPFFSPTGIAVDSKGDIFVSDSENNWVIEEMAVGASYDQIIVDRNLGSPSGIALDGRDSLYVADSGNSRVLKDTLSYGNFGAVGVATASTKMTLIFSYADATPGTMLPPVVLTNGMVGMDFTDAGTGTCSINGPAYIYQDGDTCTVDVVFTPTAAGLRYGAVVLKDNSGNVLATAYVQGTGLGPQLSFPPGTTKQLSFSNVNAPYAIAADGAGNLYIDEAVKINDPGNVIVKETWTASGYTQYPVATGLAFPVGVAVDGAGNVFIADQDATAIVEASPSPTGYTVNTILPGLGNVEGVAVDGSGNLYITSNAYGVIKETYSAITQSYTQTTIASSIFGNGIAVDGAGVVYVSSVSPNAVLLETPSNGSYTQTVIASNLTTNGIAVDGNANIYAGVQGGVVKETLTASGYVQSNALTGVSGYVLGVALDGVGNAYAASVQANSVWEMDFSDPPALKFATTPVGQTSSDSPQIVTIENTGNAAGSIPVPSSGTNPALPSGFVLNTDVSSACSSVSANASAWGTLPIGASCEFSVTFSPVSAGADNGWLALTYSGPNAGPLSSSGYRTMNLLLRGTGVQAVPTNILTASANPAFASTPVAFAANLSSGNVAPTGIVSFYDGTTLLGLSTVSSGIATYSTSALPAGQHSITAAYSGDPNFKAVTSAAVVETVEDFSFAPTSGATYSATVSPGGNAVYTLPFAPVNGTTFPAAIAFTVTGLPAGATPTFSPNTIPAGAGATNVTLTVALANQSVAQSLHGPFFRGRMVLGLAVILLPLGSIRRKSSRGSKTASLLGLCFTGIFLAAGLTGCGGSSMTPTQPQTQSYTLMITASSGSLSHSVTAILNVK